MKTLFYSLTAIIFFLTASTANAQQPPTCILSASPNPIESGQSSRLTWTAENAVSASINQGIGTVWHFGGNKEISPRTTTFYTLTVVGELSQTGECQAMVEVLNPTTSGGNTFTPSRFIPCEGKSCSACNLVELGNEVIVWLFGIVFLLFAVLMAVAGFGLVTSSGNPSALNAAKDKFSNAMIGLVIIMSAWLIVDTLMRALVGGGDTGAAVGEMEGWGPWSKVKCQVQTPTITPIPGSGGVTTTTTATGTCPIAPLSPPLTDPVSVRLESGATVIWENTDPQLRRCAEKKGGVINSAYRPESYQQHLYEVWDKWCHQGLKDNTTSACSPIKSAVGEEMNHHQLSCNRLVARTASNHGSGRAVDISGAPHTNDQCLDWFGPRDDIHYTLRAGCTCN